LVHPLYFSLSYLHPLLTVIYFNRFKNSLFILVKKVWLSEMVPAGLHTISHSHADHRPPKLPLAVPQALSSSTAPLTPLKEETESCGQALTQAAGELLFVLASIPDSSGEILK
jgi:hypothetical protein